MFAARAGGKGTELACGDDLVPCVHHANVWQGQSPYVNTWDDGWLRTSAVGSYPANGYSLVDMIGNVWEWTGDWWSLPRRRESLRWELLRWPEARRRRRGDQRRSCRSPRHLPPRSEGRVKPLRSQLSAAFPPVGPTRTSNRYVHVAYQLSVRGKAGRLILRGGYWAVRLHCQLVDDQHHHPHQHEQEDGRRHRLGRVIGARQRQSDAGVAQRGGDGERRSVFVRWPSQEVSSGQRYDDDDGHCSHRAVADQLAHLGRHANQQGHECNHQQHVGDKEDSARPGGRGLRKKPATDGEANRERYHQLDEDVARHDADEEL